MTDMTLDTTATDETGAGATDARVPQHGLVWAEIPVSDLEAGIVFYTAVTGGALDRFDMGPDKTAMIRTDPPMEGASAHLYVGKPAGDGTGPTVHLSVEGTAEEASARAEAAGGRVLGPVIEIPYGRFVYITDPDGNSVGLFEPKAS
ncbi:MAG: VOC family protein [Pseudomonadota bacterium]